MNQTKGSLLPERLRSTGLDIHNGCLSYAVHLWCTAGLKENAYEGAHWIKWAEDRHKLQNHLNC
jgi:hypothetical protein